MQICKVSVNLGGKTAHQVIGKLVTVPEIQVLQHIHGVESVFDIVLEGEIHRLPAEEIERLSHSYTPKTVKEVFPGVAPKLPQVLADIGLDIENLAQNLEAKAKEMLDNAAKLRGKAVATKGEQVAAPPTLEDIFGEAKAA
jgi:hypothetical protein